MIGCFLNTKFWIIVVFGTTVIDRWENNESSEVCCIIKPGLRVKLIRSQAVNVHKLPTIRSGGLGHMFRPIPIASQQVRAACSSISCALIRILSADIT